MNDKNIFCVDMKCLLPNCLPAGGDWALRPTAQDFSPTHLLAFILLSMIFCTPIYADSLYPGSSTEIRRTDAAAVSLFSDNKARHIGDTLIVVINENASTTSVAATKNSKNENLSYGPGFGPLLSKIPAFGLTGNIGSNASGSTNRTDNLSAQIAVTVMSVLPNGNLLIQGNRSVGMNAETQKITLTGIVRPVDIAPDNTISSPLVANAEIKYGGKGPVGDKQHDGIIARVFKFLF